MFRPAVPLLLTGAALLASGCSLHTAGHQPKPDRPIAAVRPLKPQDQPCAARGIAPDSGPEGICRAASGAIVHMVDREHDLRMQSLWVHVVKVKTGTEILPAGTFGEVRHAKGRFLFVGVALDNVGNESVDDLDLVSLQVDGKTYDQDFGAEFDLMPTRDLPLQPGMTGAAALVFDLPPDAAEAAKDRGVVVFPNGRPFATVQDAQRLGEIRLGTEPDMGPALHTEA
jgi:PBP1b-binding outer membrane lipoprotein LpoB